MKSVYFPSSLDIYNVESLPVLFHYKRVIVTSFVNIRKIIEFNYYG